MADAGAGAGGGGEEDGSVRELDKYLPTANIARIMKKVLLRVRGWDRLLVLWCDVFAFHGLEPLAD